MANRAKSGSSLALSRVTLAAAQWGEAHSHPKADEIAYLFKERVAIHTGLHTFLLEVADFRVVGLSQNGLLPGLGILGLSQ
jgi:hypothetical protein